MTLEASLAAIRTAAFRGEVLTEDAWRGRDFGGLRVAVLASAEAAARIVPVVASTAAAVKVFQEQPALLLPALPPATPRLVRTASRLAARERHLRTGIGRLHLRVLIKDPWLRRQLTPDIRDSTRRPAAGSAYYRALQQPNCKLITWPVYAIVATGVRTAEGIEHEVDCIVLGSAATTC